MVALHASPPRFGLDTNLVLLRGLAYGGAARLPTQIRIRYEPCSSQRPRIWWRCTPPHPDSDYVRTLFFSKASHMVALHASPPRFGLCTNLVLLTGLAYGGAARLPTQIRIMYEPCSSHRPRIWWRCTPHHPDRPGTATPSRRAETCSTKELYEYSMMNHLCSGSRMMFFGSEPESVNV